MIFWIFVILFIVSIMVCITHEYDAFELIGIVTSAISGVVVIISFIAILCNHVGADATVARNQKIYESLVYQYDNDIYEDSILGKKQLYDQIQEWNKDLAHYQSVQDDFWIGIYYPNIFDQFKFIEYK